MKARLAKSVLVMVVAVVIAAILQELVPAFSAAHVKVPCLLGVAVYYAMCREPGYGVMAAVWCGVLQDGLGNIPYGVSLISFCVISLLCILVLRRQLPENTVSCMIVGMAGGFMTQVLQYAALVWSGQYAVLPFLFLMLRAAAVAAVSGLTAGIVALIVRHMDCVSGNAGFENEGDSFSWNNN